MSKQASECIYCLLILRCVSGTPRICCFFNALMRGSSPRRAAARWLPALLGTRKRKDHPTCLYTGAAPCSGNSVPAVKNPVPGLIGVSGTKIKALLLKLILCLVLFVSSRTVIIVVYLYM